MLNKIIKLTAIGSSCLLLAACHVDFKDLSNDSGFHSGVVAPPTTYSSGFSSGVVAPSTPAPAPANPAPASGFHSGVVSTATTPQPANIQPVSGFHSGSTAPSTAILPTKKSDLQTGFHSAVTQ